MQLLRRRWFSRFPLSLALIPLVGVAAHALTAEVVSPRPGEELTGTVTVTARVVPQPGEKPHQVVLQTSSGDSLLMERTVADTYRVELDTTKLRNGRQALLVVATVRGRDEGTLHADARKPWQSSIRSWCAEAEVKVANPYRYFWGDLHAHTSYSDGSGLPADAYRYARDKAHLDFFAVTDHSPLLTFEEYQDTIDQANLHNQPGRFVALYGCESTEAAGHINFYLSPTPRLPMRLDNFYRALGESDLLGHFNHPGVSSPADQNWQDDFEAFHYSPWADRSMALVEVRSLNEEQAYIRLLEAGWHVGAAGCQDQHEQTWGTGRSSWTVALARELTTQAILDALRSRRTYSAGDRNLQVSFTLDGEDMGSRFSRPAGNLTSLVSVFDPDESHVIDRIDLILDGQVVASTRPKLPKYTWAIPIEPAPGSHYCFVRITQAGGHTTWTSPIWVTTY